MYVASQSHIEFREKKINPSDQHCEEPSEREKKKKS